MIDGYVLTTTSYITCVHGGRFTHIPTYTPGFLIDGSTICREGDPFSVSCPMGANSCHRVAWEYDTSGIQYFGKAILTTSSQGWVFNSQGVSGPVVFVAFQTKVTLGSFIEALKKGNS